MTAIIDLAYDQLRIRLARALVGCGFLTLEEDLQADPDSEFEPSPDAVGLEVAAEIFRLGAAPTRQLSGGGRAHYVVEETYHLVLTCAGPAPSGDGAKSRLDKALTVLAPVADDDPGLDGACERVWLEAVTPGDLPPNGRTARLAFVVRLRAADPLGRTPL